jgi:hypothetical protein
MSLYDVIDRKVIDYAEIVVCLFDHCNLRCAFCPQHHDDLLGASRDEILAKVPGIVNWINNNTRSKYFKIHIMGGEVFEDIFIEQGFIEIYQDFIDQIKNSVPKEKHVEINFITNLVFQKHQTVLDFLNINNLKVSTSYDPRGRFTAQQFETFKNNIEIFKDYISMFSVVTTRQNIEAVIKGDSYFDYLYQNFVCDWDSFIPAIAETAEAMMPSEQELLNFYKHLVDHYPDCINIEYFTGNEKENHMSCTRGNSYTILRDGSMPGGCSGAVFLKDAETKNLESTIILHKFFDTYDCFSCEYFKKCPFTCFIKNDYKKIKRDLGSCVFKETFRYVDSKHKSIIH